MQPPHLLHVLCDRVLLQELCALTRVETFCVSEELAFEVLFVHGQRGAFGEGILLVQTQLNWTRHNRERPSVKAVTRKHQTTGTY